METRTKVVERLCERCQEALAVEEGLCVGCHEEEQYGETEGYAS